MRTAVSFDSVRVVSDGKTIITHRSGAVRR